MKIPVDQIDIGKRQRLDLGDLDDLATSLAELGQINPITVVAQPDGTFLLVTGRRRLGAAFKLGWKEIEAREHGNIDELTKQRIEFEEDVKRKDRTWQEQCLAVAKLHKMMTYERMDSENEWTVRSMAKFTGMSKSLVAYMIQVAEFLTKEPKDEDIWAAASYVDAVKIIVNRECRKVQDELERRRLNAQNAVIVEAQPSQGPVQDLDNTEQMQFPSEENMVFTFGRSVSFTDACPGVDFSKDSVELIIGYGEGGAVIPNIEAALSKTGMAIVWFNNGPDMREFAHLAQDHGLIVAPYYLVWNRLVPTETKWPFYVNILTGLMITKEQLALPEGQKPLQGVISGAELEGNEIAPVVIATLNGAMTKPGQAVITYGNVPPLGVVQDNRVPIWFEPDETAFAKKQVSLEVYYKETIPNVKVLPR